MMGVLINSSTIRVSKQGVDPASASFDDLFLAIGMRTGQILQTGAFALNGSGPGSFYNGAGSFGPFSQAPDAVGYVVSNDGRAHWPPAISNFNGTSTGPGALLETWVSTVSEIDANSINVTGWYQDQAPPPSQYTYVIFRKPSRS